MFEDMFSVFHKKNDEIRAIGVWGKDGLVLDKQYFNPGDTAGMDIDLDFSGAELADILSKLDNARVSSGSFFLRLQYHEFDLLIYSLTAEYFLIILAEKAIIEAKVRFYLDLYRDRLAAAL